MCETLKLIPLKTKTKTDIFLLDSDVSLANSNTINTQNAREVLPF
jgi:hypothetical protein